MHFFAIFPEILSQRQTVQGMYRTADLVLQAPVAELKHDTAPATGM